MYSNTKYYIVLVFDWHAMQVVFSRDKLLFVFNKLKKGIFHNWNVLILLISFIFNSFSFLLEKLISFSCISDENRTAKFPLKFFSPKIEHKIKTRLEENWTYSHEYKTVSEELFKFVLEINISQTSLKIHMNIWCFYNEYQTIYQCKISIFGKSW